MRITAPAAGQAFRLQKYFKRPTQILIQVKHATAKFFFDTEQGAAQNGGSGPGTDGICLMAANTNPAVTPSAVAQPFTVTGELWYSTDTTGADFVIFECPSVTAGG